MYIQYVQIVYIQYICIYMYSLSSITAVSLYGVPPPNTIIQLVVGVTLQTERELSYLLVTFFRILTYKNITINFCIINYTSILYCVLYIYKPHPQTISHTLNQYSLVLLM